MVIPVGPPDADRPPARPSRYALAGTILLALGGLFFMNLDEGGELFMVLSMVCAGPGLYLLIVGGVARGNALRRD